MICIINFIIAAFMEINHSFCVDDDNGRTESLQKEKRMIKRFITIENECESIRFIDWLEISSERAHLLTY